MAIQRISDICDEPLVTMQVDVVDVELVNVGPPGRYICRV